ncbi:MAG: hypothetical protein ACTHW8_14335 [Sphingobacterium sp.]
MILNKMKIGQLLTGLAIVAIAFGASAFTVKERVAEMAIVNTGNNHELEEDYDPDNCLAGSPTCAYTVLNPEELDGETQFSPAEIEEFLDNGWIEARPEQGLYQL